ncbi:hypothetical protein HS048_05125 [Planomonospora sp. ID91781]|uniref:hypothetical protein n=1 Tax=Planomonospora sp. ID91781 TaxID=2738135 RepID=UPI0018C362E5|nr:hypothetical protein [Planomonospora sp. ID91781]MBG0820119.1 hypothetical protein [Planomonospora sp. ID91781]
MSPATRSVQVIMMIQAAFGLIGGLLSTALLVGATIEPRDTAWTLYLLHGSGIAVALLVGWLASRWRHRRRKVWIAALAAEGFLTLGYLLILIIDSDLSVRTLLNPNLLLPGAALLLLLLPSMRSWFER